MTALPPKKNLVKSTALAKTQSTLVRLNNLIPTTTTVLSPTTVYQPGASSVGNELSGPTQALPNIGGWYGSWTAPDLNNGSPYQVQVECFGPGGGGGGGIAAAGGGGGGGGEYACEPAYTVSPGVTYTYQIGLPGTAGCNNSSATLAQEGTAGSQTIFDLAGVGIPGGVVANPGQPGDAGSTGTGGNGGTGSQNTMAFAGGPGGTNQSGLGSDNAIDLAETSGMFHANSKNPAIIRAWYIFNDGPDSTFEFNDSSTYHNTATVTTSGNGIHILQANAPAQVPAYEIAASPPHFPNPQAAGCTSLWNGAANNTYAGYAQAPAFAFSGTVLTVSCWIQCDPTGTWGNSAANGIGTICANSKNYYTFGAFVGFGLFMKNNGSQANPVWTIYAQWGDNTIANFVATPLPAVVGTWYYIVATFNSGTITLYVNGVNVSSGAAGFSSLPGASYNMRVGTNPSSTGQYFFGYISNLWFASDAATSALPTAAFGSTSPTGGAGGGSSGSAGGVGGVGNNATGTFGGSGGVVTALPVQYASIRSAGSNGVAGSNAAAGNGSAVAGIGAGGGGSGSMAGSPATTTITIPFATAATYCGTDSSSPGALYNASQQTGNSVIVTGGVSTDSASGSKNTLVLLPKGIASSLGSGKWTIQQITLTLTNSLLSGVDTVLEFATTADTTLPQNYTGADAGDYVGAIPLDAGQNTVTYDLTQSNLGTLIQNGSCTALCFGPADNPTFDAYNASTGAQFYCQVYGPGAVDNFGNSLQPYLTVVLQKTLTTQTGSDGGTGVIAITSLTDATTPIGIIQAFAGADDAGNQYASGYTGQAAAFQPGVSPTVVETWHYPSLNGAFISQSGSQKIGYRFEALNKVHIIGVLKISTGTSMTGTIFTVPAGYRPVATTYMPVSGFSIGSLTGTPYLVVDTGGNVTMVANGTVSTNTAIVISCIYPLDGLGA